MAPVNVKWILYSGYGISFALIFISYLITDPLIDDHHTILYKALKSNYFDDATLISVGISSQILLHLLLETLASIRTLKLHIGTRWSGNLAYAFTNVIIWLTLRLDIITGRIYFMLQFIQLTVFVFGHVGALNAMYPDIWTNWKSFGIATTFSLYYVFTFQDQYVLRFTTIFGVLAFTCYLLASVMILETCFIWYKKFLHKRKFAEMGQKESVNFSRIFSFVIWFLGVACILIYYQDTKLEDFDVTYITTYSYVIMVNTVLYSVAYARKIHFEAAEVSVRERTFVTMSNITLFRRTFFHIHMMMINKLMFNYLIVGLVEICQYLVY